MLFADNFWKSVVRVDPSVRKCLMPDTGMVFKKMPKSSFQRNFFKNGTHFNKLLYHWTANYCDKHINHCSYTFTSIWPSCFCKVKHMGESCNGVDRLVQWCRSLRNVRWTGTESQSRLLPFLCKFRRTLTGRFSKSLTVYTFLKKTIISARARAARKKHFCTRVRLPAQSYMKTGFDNAERQTW